MTEARRWLAWLAFGCVGYVALPWYALEDGFLAFGSWVRWFPADPETGPAPWQASLFARPWLWGYAPLLALPLLALRYPRADPRHGRLLVAAGAVGLVFGLAQGFAIGPLGWASEGIERLFGPIAGRQHGMGVGAVAVHLAFLFVLTEGCAASGRMRGDAFLTGVLGLAVALVVLFVLLPVATMLARGLEAEDGSFSLGVLARNLFAARVWAFDTAAGHYGTAWKSLFLAMLAGAGSTALGLAFALVVTRTRFRAKRLLRALTVLPIITPPFVIGLALILVFGRSGVLTTWLETTFGIPASRSLYGLPGLLVAQLLGFTPIAFLVLVGVVEGVSPSMEEAAQTLGASRWRTFRTVTWPLVRPGLANAFLLGFAESLADFGNPLVLGGTYDVLATETYFAVTGSQIDVPRAAALALLLLVFTLVVVWLQERWVGRRSYVTVAGKGDGGRPAPLPRAVAWAALGVALPWAAFTVAIYALILGGGFVRLWGRDATLTLDHFRAMFGWPAGAAWDSLGTTLAVAAVSAPLTAIFGVLTAWLLARHRFRGRRAFEWLTLLSFAIPGTVVGIGYVLAFNVPPIELTGTAAVLVACFVFRNAPVGLRAGLAALAQVDPSLDEASKVLGARTGATLRRVVLPLVRPAVLAALVFGFVRAVTAVSAVVFLVSADHDLATTAILGRVEMGDYGPAVAYCGVLIVLMLAVVGAAGLALGRRELGRRGLALSGGAPS